MRQANKRRARQNTKTAQGPEGRGRVEVLTCRRREETRGSTPGASSPFTRHTTIQLPGVSSTWGESSLRLRYRKKTGVETGRKRRGVGGEANLPQEFVGHQIGSYYRSSRLDGLISSATRNTNCTSPRPPP